ncbi:MAG: tetratricopeptide repeat protein, partial [Microcoleus sp. SIO2G3]|nr:tetratricopeptide repeat protein [Microcoleus sp. SIO2G3]
SQGRYSEAESLYVQALALRRQLLGEEHPNLASSLNNLAGLYRSQGRYSEAEPLLVQALTIFEARLGVNHPNTVVVRQNLEIVRQQMQPDREALPQVRPTQVQPSSPTLSQQIRSLLRRLIR